MTFQNCTSSVSQPSSSDDTQKGCTVGMAGMVLSLLSSTWFPLDLSAHQDALILTGNLLAGKGKKKYPIIFTISIRTCLSYPLGQNTWKIGQKKQRQNFTLMRFETLLGSRLFSSEQLNFVHICQLEVWIDFCIDENQNAKWDLVIISSHSSVLEVESSTCVL